MRLTLIFIAILGFSSSCEIGDFYMGLIEGFEVDPNIYGNCGTNLELLGNQFGSVITSLDSYLEQAPGALTSLIQNIQSFLQTYDSIPSECDFTDFKNALLQFTTPEGQNAIFQNYVHNMGQINSLSLNVETCGLDYKLCGSSVGSILKLLTGANLQIELKNTLEDNNNSQFDFLQGFLGAYAGQYAKTPLCKGNVLRLMPSFDGLFKDIASGKGLHDYLMLLVEKAVLKTCWRTDWKKEWNPIKIIEFLNIAFHIKAWKLSYFMNTEAMNNYIHQISHCSENYFNCGQAIPAILELNKVWIHYDKE
ncbi:hypothetical protein SteCoe_30255 [Stentor coeruleus]|uniref:Uncharacterized protein n=1 Tax=Stentor coeruleus TaxID=5963 RepID=A0A1R2B3X0_9CILI|nr:hypothetical protein SteCoe_30255 [Stentor coeruleus]